MGAKTAVLVYTDGNPAVLLRDAPDLDPEATKVLIAKSNPARAGTACSSSGSLATSAAPVTEADLQEFMRTRTRRRYRLGPGGTLVPIED